MLHRPLPNPTKLPVYRQYDINRDSYIMFDEIEKQAILKVKTAIVTHLQDRLRDLPVTLQNIIVVNGILTGGASASLFHGDTPNDFDIFLETDHAIKVFKGETMDNVNCLSLVADANPKYFETLVAGKMVTGNAITFKNGLQVIMMDKVNARETFDFIHCQPYYRLMDQKYHISKDQFESIKYRKLVKNTHPNAKSVTERRLKKFNDRGWV